MMNDFGLVIVHYRDQDAVERLLESTAQWTYRPSRIVVVDNSQDLSSVAFPEQAVASIIQLDNVGYGGAVNRGLEMLAAESFRHAMICTQDATMSEDTAAKLSKAISGDSRIAVAAPVLSFASDASRPFSYGGTLSERGVSLHNRVGPPPVATGPYDVDWVDGAILFVDVEAIMSVGGYDEAYFLYVEEVDLQFTLRQEGKRVVMVADAHGCQEPGHYPDYLRYRNSVYLTRKFRATLKPWPWARLFARDTARHLSGRIRFAPLQALRGVRDGHDSRMGKRA